MGRIVELEHFKRDRKVTVKIEKTRYKARRWTETTPEVLRTIAIESTSNNVILVLSDYFKQLVSQLIYLKLDTI
ncbi:hypothetical protein [Methanosarcina sp. UBA5]|uniref:hypothetical protein n=1 Tax=Methanosarcina sp. UBA5 TaxID=1915593 RepID=UPI0025E66842|nr:hypothetical protein [Methanosarcina sp. UBA5]